MGRQQSIARSIALAVTAPGNNNGGGRGSNNGRQSTTRLLAYILALFSHFFSLYELVLRRIRPADFANLRRTHWQVADDAYHDSFRPRQDAANREDALTAIGDMGFSGSVRLSHHAIRMSDVRRLPTS